MTSSLHASCGPDAAPGLTTDVAGFPGHVRAARHARRLLAIIVVALAATPTLALAATTMSPSSGPPGATVSLTVRATEDRTGDLSASVTLTVADGFDVLGCRSAPGWECSSGGSSARWTRTAAADLTLLTSDLGATITTPDAAGDYLFELVQQYGSGGSASTAPTFRVEAAPEPTPTTAPAPTEPEPTDSQHPADAQTQDPAPRGTPTRSSGSGTGTSGGSANTGPKTLAELMSNGKAFIVAADGPDGGIVVTATDMPEQPTTGDSGPRIGAILAGVGLLALAAGLIGWQVLERRSRRVASRA